MTIIISNQNASDFNSTLFQTLETEVLNVIEPLTSSFAHLSDESVTQTSSGVGAIVMATLRVESPVTTLESNDLLIALLDEADDNGFGVFDVSDVTFAAGACC